MPTIKTGEKRNDYVKRAVPMMIKEGLTQAQSVGKAEGMFSNKKRKGLAKALKG